MNAISARLIDLLQAVACSGDVAEIQRKRVTESETERKKRESDR